MNERPLQVSDDIAKRQKLASDPLWSVWVGANAGSGKTHVLTERVLRLLLLGVGPENILCLTYTKAAAANMRAGVAKKLGEWALMDEPDLARVLGDLSGAIPDSDGLAMARTLFARALETPGGLKINTIHAFSEALLHRFPLEAGVPHDFAVIEEIEQKQLIERARIAVLASGLAGDPEAGAAVGVLFAEMSDHGIEKAIDSALSEMGKLREVLTDRKAAKARLRKRVGFVAGMSVGAIEREVIGNSLLSPAELLRLVEYERGKATKSKFSGFDPVRPGAEMFFASFLTAAGEAPKNFNVTKALAAALPDLAEKIMGETERVAALFETLKMLRLVRRSEALLDVLAAIVARYEAEKRRRVRLDFDDLIARTKSLLGDRESSDWVRYKLDASIAHILVDESQDTNPDQWALVKLLAEEFFSGDSAIEGPRTLFAVGDEKQSIFSFQGADPRLFAETGMAFRIRAGLVARKWRDVELKASFRTLPNILLAVDAVAKDPVIKAALVSEDHPIQHETARKDAGGQVVLWPPVVPEPEPELEDEWPPPEAARPPQTAPRRLAERIAGAIGLWLSEQRPLGARQRAIRADDILILVQSRKELFFEIIRALRRAGIPCPGADRLAVASHIAVLDLMGLADVLLHHDDDLQLAAVLRSPLFSVSEEALFLLAHERGEGVSLWQALMAASFASAKDAAAQLAGWTKRLDFDRPYEFFASVLYAGGGLKKFHARLGSEVDDVLMEFLDLALAHEKEAQPSLQGFLAAMRVSEITIKRELPEGGGVRIMTVHGAKGLEAPIVILADAASKPEGAAISRPIYFASENDGPILVHAGGADDHIEATRDMRAELFAREGAEYWRRLYVGMTRAEDELYLSGYLDKRAGALAAKIEGSWYGAVEQALGDQSVPQAIPGEPESIGLVFPSDRPAPAPIVGMAVADPGITVPALFAPLPARVALPLLQPSGAGHGLMPGADLARPAEDLALADRARRRGIALHALLHHLVAVPSDKRLLIAGQALEALLPDGEDIRAGLADKALSILGRAEFSDLFGPMSRGEVAFSVDGQQNGKPVRLAGRIDRLIAMGNEILIVDFKSDANVPKDEAEMPASYPVQLGLYVRAMERIFQGKAVGAAILWTEDEKLMRLAPERLAKASAGFAAP